VAASSNTSSPTGVSSSENETTIYIRQISEIFQPNHLQHNSPVTICSTSRNNIQAGRGNQANVVERQAAPPARKPRGRPKKNPDPQTQQTATIQQPA
jgi:hypothetical protein